MATMKQYAVNLWKTHKVVCARLGMDVDWGGLDKRVQVLSSDIMLAGLLKVLVDKGVVTDAQLVAAYDQILGAQFPCLPSSIPARVDDGVIPDPDLGA